MNAFAGQQFTGQVVIVTGASRGIGAAVARAFAGAGAHVVGVSRTQSVELAAELNERFSFVPMDFSTATAEQLDDLIAHVIARHGRLDVLINNAGIIRRAPATEHARSDWDEVLHVNLTVPFLLSQSAARWWMSGGRAGASGTVPRGEPASGREADALEIPDRPARLRIVNIASLLSFQGGLNVVSYAAAKHGIAGVTKALANEWAKEGINVNAVAPGYVETENTAPLRADAARNAAILARIPSGNWAAAEDIAGGCLFLASSQADYCHGITLPIDGGWLGR